MFTIDPVRACAACQKEHGIRPEAGTSHGYCQRHLVQNWNWLHQMAVAKGSPAAAEYLAKIAAIQARPASDFPADLGEPQAIAA